jgi:hypothetical protein
MCNLMYAVKLSNLPLKPFFWVVTSTRLAGLYGTLFNQLRFSFGFQDPPDFLPTIASVFPSLSAAILQSNSCAKQTLVGAQV